MGLIHLIRSRYAARWRSSSVEYTLLGSYGSPVWSSHGDIWEKMVHGLPMISGRTTPNFEILVNFDKIRHFSLPVLMACLPSFLQRTPARHAPRKLLPTSYLDGVRGIAALFVVFHHYALAFTSSSSHGWKSREDMMESWVLQLPIFRVVHAGRFMVTIFFVLSGYVLSYRGLKLARDGELAKLLESLASSVFRRWLRLSIPVIVSTYIGFLLARYSLWYELPDGWEHWAEGTHHAWKPVPLPVVSGNFTAQFWDWYSDTQRLVDPFRYGVVEVSHYNINILWTISIEWMGSMIVFATVLGICLAKTWVKITVLSGMIYWCHYTTRWEPATFLSGVLLAELSFIRVNINYIFAEVKKSSLERPLYFISRIFWTFVFLSGIYIGSHPQDSAATTPGYRNLIHWTPSQYGGKMDFWPCIGGTLTILALENAPFLQIMFTTRFAQYLGKISFSLYMLHFMVMSTLAHWLVPKCMNVTGGWENGQLGFVSGMVLAVVVVMPVTFWVSDVYSTMVDEKSVRFAKWVSDKAFVRDNEKTRGYLG